MSERPAPRPLSEAAVPLYGAIHAVRRRFLAWANRLLDLETEEMRAEAEARGESLDPETEQALLWRYGLLFGVYFAGPDEWELPPQQTRQDEAFRALLDDGVELGLFAAVVPGRLYRRLRVEGADGAVDEAEWDRLVREALKPSEN